MIARMGGETHPPAGSETDVPEDVINRWELLVSKQNATEIEQNVSELKQVNMSVCEDPIRQ